MDYIYAGISVFAAGFLFRSAYVGLSSFGFSDTKTTEWVWIGLRGVAFFAMLAFGFEASSLFGNDQLGETSARMAAALWLLQFIVALIFVDKPGHDKSGQHQH